MIIVADATLRIDDVELLPPTSFEVEAGEVLSIRGANGSGKSTLLSLVAGLHKPTGGSVTVHGSTPDDRDPAFRRAVSAALGGSPTARDLTLREHLTLVAATWAAPDAEGAADAELKAWGIARLQHRYPHELSSGQRQLFTLALAWIRPATVLLLDEPEQRLDAERRGILIARMRDRGAAGCSVLVATHADDVERASDSVIWLDA